MLTLSTRHQILAGLSLALLMAATRGHHFASLTHLPSASWAVFFLAGVYVRPMLMLPALLAEAALLDYAAIAWGGVSDFCVSPAYGFLAPAYGALWLAGRLYARSYRFRLQTLVPLTVCLMIGTIVCQFLSSGGFYFFSGKFADPNMTEFAARLVKFYPGYVQSFLLYVGLAAIAHVTLVMAHGGQGTSDARMS